MTDTAGIILRTIFGFIDRVVYWLVDQVYWLFSLLSEATLFTQDQIKDFSNRIYVLVSIIMLFKLGFSFITYIVNPDTITDKQKGGGKLISNIVITIALLISVPAIFNEAYYLQNAIFQNNIIDKIMLGNSVQISSNADKTKLLSAYTFMSFFRPTTKLSECQNYEGIELSKPCIDSLDSKSDKKPGTAYATALKEGNIGMLFDNEMLNLTAPFAGRGEGDFYQTTEYFIFDYHYLVSTIVGGFLAFILLGFCLDLAIRSVKLGFLQIIAPIPILLSLTPGKKNNTLGNWGKECLSTWASLFVRVGIISFALNLILMINNGGGIVSFVSGGQNNYPMVTIFVTIGILMFAKEFPKLLENILGIKGAGKLTLNPLKKLNTDMVGAGIIGGAVSGLAGGGIGGMFRGAFAGRGAKTLGEGVNKAGTSIRNNRLAQENGSDFLGRTSARFSQITGRESALEKLDRKNREREEEIQGVKTEISNREKIVRLIEGQEDAAKNGIKTGKGGVYTRSYNAEVSNISSLEADLQSATTAADRNRIAADITKAKNKLEKNLGEWSRQMIDDIQSGVISGYDSGLSDSISAQTVQIQSAASAYGISVKNDPDARHDQAGQFTIQNINAQSTITSTEYEIEQDKISQARKRAKANQDAVGKK